MKHIAAELSILIYAVLDSKLAEKCSIVQEVMQKNPN